MRYPARAFLPALLAIPSLAPCGDSPRSVVAVRVAEPPVVDGRLDDPVWSIAEPAAGFIQRDPEEGLPASEPTEIRVVYDDGALYFGCRYFDSRPGEIVSRLSRRDIEGEFDRGSVRIDSYHDGRTAFEFTFTPAGGKVDIIQYDDGDREDVSWDVVWDLKTAIDTLGWTAELRIPFHALRYHADAEDTTEQVWGINFTRRITRKKEQDRWVFVPKSESGFVSRFGHLRGLHNLPRPRRIEIVPYVLSEREWLPASDLRGRVAATTGNAGLDVKVGLSNNLTLDLTLNPDFGQVEADPAVLNLSTIETFYPERRPFFIEGTQILRFSTFGGGSGLFYTRRIGRGIDEGEAEVPDSGRILSVADRVTILGAAKVTGKIDGGLSVGALQAVTRREHATVTGESGSPSRQMIEPEASYTVVRVQKDLPSASTVGVILTGVARHSRMPAITGGVDWLLRLDDQRYQLGGFLAGSMTGETGRLTGTAGQIRFGRDAAEHWLWSASADFTSREYNVNDVGFFRRPDDFGGRAELEYKEDTPAAVVRRYETEISFHMRHNFAGANLNRRMEIFGDVTFHNYWRVLAEVGIDAGAYDDRETRGNGLYRRPVSWSVETYVVSDDRHVVGGSLRHRLIRDEHGRQSISLGGAVQFRPASWMEWEVEAQVQTVRGEEAWVTNEDRGGGLVSVFGDRDTETFDLTVRGTLAFTPELTFDSYGQLFFAGGRYRDFRDLRTPSSFSPSPFSGSPDFSSRSLTANLVLRWEYSPGSTLYLVWSHSRSGGSPEYLVSFRRHVGDVFRTPPANILLLKISYWWSV